MAALGLWLFPRARAAFELHGMATAAADYGVCMVGPTGAAALRDNPQTFAAMVRRRLLEAQPQALPFDGCATLAREVSGSPEVEQAHRAPALEFVEYGGSGPTLHSLAELSFGLGSLSSLARAAWPLERGGFAKLIKPSSHAREAPHPVAPNPPAVGRGLPGARTLYASAWVEGGSRFVATGHASNLKLHESKDGGLNWQAISLAHPGVAEHAGRCVSAGSTHGFLIEFAESAVMIRSLLADAVVYQVRIDGATDVLATGCDEEAMLMVLTRGGRRDLVACAHAGRCSSVPHRPDWLEAHFDVARVAGANVVATARAGIVRVRSSRDQGRSWTPDTVAFDWAAQPLRSDVKVPSRLLAIGKELWLYGAAAEGQSYPVLFSVDMGTSWYAPNGRANGSEQLRAQR